MGWKSQIPDRAEHVRLALKSIVDEGWSLLEGDMVPAKALIKGCRTATDNDISKLSIKNYQNIYYNFDNILNSFFKKIFRTSTIFHKR